MPINSDEKDTLLAQYPNAENVFVALAKETVQCGDDALKSLFLDIVNHTWDQDVLKHNLKKLDNNSVSAPELRAMRQGLKMY